jgi:hypothetical protein
MAGRNHKSDPLRIAELTEKIEKADKLIAVQSERLRRYKAVRAKLLAHLIVGQMEVRNLNYPQVESLLTQLFKNEPSKCPSVLLSKKKDLPVQESAGNQIVELKVRVTEQERRQMYENMKKAQYTSFNSYAKKMLLDGYLIVWGSPETRELKKELGNVNRSLNQLVKRANVTGSIYKSDFVDMLECWKKIQKEVLHYIDEMNRKGV